MRLRRLVLTVPLLLAPLAACGSSTPKAGGSIVVFAAASLKESFSKIATDFQTANPGVKVTLNFAASSALVTQITQGAPADVFASADTANMKKLTDAKAAADPKVFATNKLEIIVGKGNPKGITGVADLAKPGLIVVTCGPDVPIGKYAAQVFTKAGVTVTPKSLEADAKAVVNKVTIGEADAGIVYSTDVRAAGASATGVVIPDDLNVVATYPIAVTSASTNATTAAAFVAYVTGAAGQATLASFGFTKS